MQYSEFRILIDISAMLQIQPKPDLIAQTHEALRRAITMGELEPGAPLAQEDLAARLGVSRQPISHALLLLKREGLVVERGRKGHMVAPLDPAKLLALYQVRGALDSLAARLCAARGLAAAEFEPLLIAGERASASGDVHAMVDADLAFHQAVHEYSGNLELSSAANTFWPHMARAMRAVLESREAWPGIWAEHRAIVDAIVSGNVDDAGQSAARHAEQAGETTFARLQQG